VSGPLLKLYKLRYLIFVNLCQHFLVSVHSDSNFILLSSLFNCIFFAAINSYDFDEINIYTIITTSLKHWSVSIAMTIHSPIVVTDTETNYNSIDLNVSVKDS